MTNKPMMMSCICIDFEKQMVIRTKRLMRVRVVIAYRNTAIADASALRTVVATTPVGQTVHVTVLRNGHQQELTAMVRNLDETTTALLNQTTQHWYTDNLRKRVVPAPSGGQVYESHMA